MLRLFVFLVIVSAVTSVRAQDDAKPPPFTEFGQPVGNFSLRGLDGDYVDARVFRGRITIVQFFYPGCNECSKTNPTMKRLQETYRGRRDVRLVSIALRYGEPNVLKEFAKDQEADLEQWLFLSDEDEKRVHQAVHFAFSSMVAESKNPTAGNMLDHSTRLVLVDPEGTMVGYVNGADLKAVDTLSREIDALRKKQRIPVTAADLPWFNALLNSTCTVLLLLGYVAIRLRYETLHKIAMLLALFVSMAFLASYLFSHFVVLGMEPTRFRGEGAWLWLYRAILFTHMILAMIVAPCALVLAVQGLRDARVLHVKLARWTLPAWLYVSVTGVVVYWMLYRMDW